MFKNEAWGAGCAWSPATTRIRLARLRSNTLNAYHLAIFDQYFLYLRLDLQVGAFINTILNLFKCCGDILACAVVQGMHFRSQAQGGTRAVVSGETATVYYHFIPFLHRYRLALNLF